MKSRKKALCVIIGIPFFLLGLMLKKNSLYDQVSSWPSYLQSMTARGTLKVSPNVIHNPYWQLIEHLYTTHIKEHPSYQTTPRIPKIIHQIWLDTPFPEHYKSLQQSVIALHPYWQYKLWTNKDLADFTLENQAAFDAATNPGERADIWRYEILYRYGGLYLDCDFECLKPFDIFHHVCDFYAGTDYYTREPLIYNGLIATAPGNPIIAQCIKTLKPRSEDHKGLKLFFDIHRRTGPLHFTVCFFQTIKDYQDKAIIFPATFFYAWPSLDRDNNTREHITSWIKPETHAIHHWGVSWLNGTLPQH